MPAIMMHAANTAAAAPADHPLGIGAWITFSLFGLCMVGMLGLPLYATLKDRKDQKGFEQTAVDEFPPELVEKVARAMCKAAGRNPDAPNRTGRWYSDDDQGTVGWHFYRSRARQFLAAQKAVSE